MLISLKWQKNKNKNHHLFCKNNKEKERAASGQDPRVQGST